MVFGFVTLARQTWLRAILSTEGPLHVIAHNPKTGSGSKECGVGTTSLPDCECSAPRVPCWHHLQLSTGADQPLDLIKHSLACQCSHGYMGCLVACRRAVCGRGSDREIVSRAALICPNHELILFDSSSVCFPDPMASTGGVSSPFAHTASADSLSSSI